MIKTLKHLRFMLVMLLATLGVNVAFGATKTYTFDDGVALATDWTVVTDVPSGGNAVCQITDALSGAGFSKKDNNYLGLAYLNKGGISITFISTASYNNIKELSFDVTVCDNSKPSFSIYIVDDNGDAIETIFENGGLKATFGNPGTNKWGSYSNTAIDSKTGHLKIVSTASSSGKYAAFDNIKISYTAATQHTVTFDKNGGDCGTSSLTEASAGAGVTLPSATPADEATQEFRGWAVSSTETDPAKIFAAGTKYEPTKNETLYAIYGAKTVKFTVRFEAGEGTGSMADVLVAVGAEYEVPACTFTVPARKEFKEWTSTDVTIADGKFIMPDADVTLTATYVGVPSVVYHYQWSGENTVPTANTALSATGGTFTFFKSESSTKEFTLAGPTYNAAVPADMKTVKASSDRLVTLNSTNNNSFVVSLTSGTFKKGDVVYIAGYGAYRVGSTHNGTDIAASVATGSAQADVNVGSFVFPAVSGVSTLYFTRDATSSNRGFTAVKVMRPYKGEIVSTEVVVTGAKVDGVALLGDDLTAFLANKTITLAGQEEEPVVKFVKQTTTTYTEGEPDVDAEDIDAEITLNGSTWEATLTINEVTYTINVPKIAHVEKFDVKFYDGSDLIDTKQIESGSTVSPEESYKSHKNIVDMYNFVNWYEDAEFNTVASFPATITAAKDFFGKWEPKTFTITYNLNDGAWDGEEGKTTYAYGDAAYTLPTNVKKDGYVFDGWELDYNHSKKSTINQGDYGDCSFTATWKEKVYASSIDLETIAKNRESETAPAIDETLEAKNIFISTLTAATWDKTNGFDTGLKIKNTGTEISFLAAAGKLVTITMGNINGVTMSVNGGAATAMAGDTKAKNFYYYSDAEQSFKMTTTVSTYNMFKAIKVEDPYTVQFDVDEGTAIEPATFKGAGLTLVDAEKADMNFDGWFTDLAKEHAVVLADDGKFYPAASCTLYAKFVDKYDRTALESLKYGEDEATATAVELVADQTTYDVVLPYKAAIPNVYASVPVADKSTLGTITQATAETKKATFTVTAEDGVTTADYVINFIEGPKDGVEILGTTVTGATSHGEMTGLYNAGASAVVNVTGTSYKMDKGTYITLTLPDGKAFAAGDVVAIDVKTVNAGEGFALFTAADGNTGIIDTRKTTVTAGWNYVILPDTYAGSQSICLLREDNNQTGDLNSAVQGMKVYRAMNPVLTALTVAGADATINETAKTISVKLPNGTVAADAELVPTIIANGGVPTAALDGTLAYDTPINYVVTDKDGDQTTYVLTATEAGLPAAEPVITVQPASHDYIDTEVIAALTVEASTTDAGVLSYQWYKGEELVGENLPTYTPTEAGSYKVVVTNTLGEETATATSEVAVITVRHIYTFNDWDGEVDFVKDGEWTIYTCNSTGKIPQTSSGFANVEIADDKSKANAINRKNFVVKFDKDMKEVRFVCYKNSSTLYDFAFLKVAETLSDATAQNYTTVNTTGKVTRELSNPTRGVEYTFIISDVHFEAGKYYFFELSNTLPIYEFFATEKHDTIRNGLRDGNIVTMCQARAIAKMEGAIPYEIEKKNPIGIDLVEAEFPLVAGKPYILQATDAVVDVVYGAGNATEVNTANGLIGNLSTAEDRIYMADYSENTQNYIFYDNHLRPTQSNYIAADRAYLNYGAVQDMTVQDDSDAAPRRRISMGGASTNTTTGIDAIQMTEETQKIMVEGQLYIIRGGRMYNVNGVLVK